MAAWIDENPYTAIWKFIGASDMSDAMMPHWDIIETWAQSVQPLVKTSAWAEVGASKDTKPKPRGRPLSSFWTLVWHVREGRNKTNSWRHCVFHNVAPFSIGIDRIDAHCPAACSSKSCRSAQSAGEEYLTMQSRGRNRANLGYEWRSRWTPKWILGMARSSQLFGMW